MLETVCLRTVSFLMSQTITASHDDAKVQHSFSVFLLSHVTHVLPDEKCHVLKKKNLRHPLMYLLWRFKP
jgi:hypothetical protein